MIDLHIHTNNSDGEFDIKTILKMAESKHLKLISFTDHETVGAYKKIEALCPQEYYSGQIITGVEIAFMFNGISMDMLGYNIDINEISNSNILQANKQSDCIYEESIKLNYLLKACEELKIVHSNNLSIKSKNDRANDVICDDILLYKENFSILQELEITNRTTFYRKHCLNSNSPFFISSQNKLPSINEVVETIHKAGGKCFLAHPYVYNVDNIKDYIDNIRNLIDGVECVHREHSNSQINMLINYCNKYNLLKSGGSDFHISSHCLGFGNKGKLPVDYALVSNWL
ncbi:PHP domain-containing protein [Clostridium neuense]|uniref:PHP domain-containing protein n=1 Tax=Clostridium neuense TaxID=1728934 RepID=A0ABW8T9M2_9CLOT